jgi:hypothetical protein
MCIAVIGSGHVGLVTGGCLYAWLRTHKFSEKIPQFMNYPATLATESDQVALGIHALMAPESPVMNFDCGKRTAGLAAPTIAVQYLFA